jgi:hypothetical protein
VATADDSLAPDSGRRDGKNWISEHQLMNLVALEVGRAAGVYGFPAAEEPRLQREKWEREYATEAQRPLRWRAECELSDPRRRALGLPGSEVLHMLDRFAAKRQRRASDETEREVASADVVQLVHEAVRADAPSQARDAVPTLQSSAEPTQRDPRALPVLEVTAEDSNRKVRGGAGTSDQPTNVTPTPQLEPQPAQQATHTDGPLGSRTVKKRTRRRRGRAAPIRRRSRQRNKAEKFENWASNKVAEIGPRVVTEWSDNRLVDRYLQTQGRVANDRYLRRVAVRWRARERALLATGPGLIRASP